VFEFHTSGTAAVINPEEEADRGPANDKEEEEEEEEETRGVMGNTEEAPVDITIFCFFASPPRCDGDVVVCIGVTSFGTGIGAEENGKSGQIGKYLALPYLFFHHAILSAQHAGLDPIRSRGVQRHSEHIARLQDLEVEAGKWAEE
jgi:hypothetical protein